MSKGNHLQRKLLGKLQLPEDSLKSTFRMQIIGGCAILCGCKKILKYSSCEISILTKEKIVVFEGEHLKCLYFYEDTVEINGDFKSVRFDEI